MLFRFEGRADADRRRGLEIRILHRQGKSIRVIARDLRVSRETVRKYLRELGGAVYEAAGATARPSKLDPFNGYRRRIRKAAPQLARRRRSLCADRALAMRAGISIFEGLAAGVSGRSFPPSEIVRFRDPTRQAGP
ncbi:helix-turn-helix domain-containing protein, partial [Jhaorihella thermophila]|uniref:helix-turn-helix domain-containing protein n=1 Tax=Jhaorihella thermophila TaxID=488547 RepID=UPI00360E2181